MRIYLTVFSDAVRAELEGLMRRENVGWFADEVAALQAVSELLLLRSAILPDLRKLPPLEIETEYRLARSRHPVERFARATRTKPAPACRRVVLLPYGAEKHWTKQ